MQHKTVIDSLRESRSHNNSISSNSEAIRSKVHLRLQMRLLEYFGKEHSHLVKDTLEQYLATNPHVEQSVS